ncbi:aldose 1-epimerase family protein [Rhodoblastus sp.]|uniref:aldose 1-epimerase family protein n=1 Tax=Rhodoblastus sp. TaxID=1962975 RepID=UPI002609550B|nr:aldose 1-epimerase family protein [Rhodoblastus sp.]
MTNEVIALSNDWIGVEIAALGAELIRLRDKGGRDFLWSGDPQYWNGRAPLLFPMVGRALGDQIKVGGKHYPLPQHGFARRSRFETVSVSPTRAVQRLEDSEATRAGFPYRFLLDIAHELRGATLAVSATVTNPGEVSLPVSFGFHPAFRWPLPGANGQHEIMFEKDETAPVRRLDEGLIAPRDVPTPVAGRRLKLDHALFAEGALIFDALASRRLVYGPSDGPSLAFSFPDLPHLALWTKPDAPFLCIEPWQGFAAPAGFDGEYAERPGVVTIAPGAERVFAMEIEVRG